MVFLKPLKDLEFADIEQLKSNKTCESDILDYKEQLLKDEDLLRHVSSFANTQGGYLIFGVKETGKGGYPEEILGIDRSQVNKERIEQIILSNIQPRLNVKIQLIDHHEASRVFVVIEIPNSYLKPHMKSQGDRFYRRYNFEAMPMTEIEVNDAYKRRFAGYQEVESYLSKVLDFKEFNPPQIIGQIAVIPTILTHMVETSNTKEFDWIGQLSFKHDTDYLPSSILTPSSNGVKFQFLDNGHVVQRLEIHRNGCIHYIDTHLERMDEGKPIFFPSMFCRKLMNTLQFATTVYQRYNYFGDVRIACNLFGLGNSMLAPNTAFWRHYLSPSQVAEINITREFPTSAVESKYEPITSGIMDEVYNSYSLWKCPFFDEGGNFKEDSRR